MLDKNMQDKQNAEQFIKKLYFSLKSLYNLKTNYTFSEKTFDFYGNMLSLSNKYILSKKASLYSINIYDYLFCKYIQNLSSETFCEYIDFLKYSAINKVKPDKHHMQSYLTLIIITDFCDKSTETLIKKTKYRKNFCFSLKGWVDIRIIVAKYNQKTVFYNPPAKRFGHLVYQNLI